MDLSYSAEDEAFRQRVRQWIAEHVPSRGEMRSLEAMRAWQERRPFLDLLCDDPEGMQHISRDELASLFDYSFFDAVPKAG
jgi:hypothetical protein